MAHVIKTLQDTLPDDPLHALFAPPPVLAALIAQGRARRRRPRRASSRRSARTSCYSTPRRGDYRDRPRAQGSTRCRRDPEDSPPGREAHAPARSRRIRRRSSCGRSSAISFHYAAVHLADIADNARDVDLAMRWGFGTAAGPVRALAGGRLGRRSRGWIAEDIDAGKRARERAAAGLGVERQGRRRARRARRRTARSPRRGTRSCRARRCRSIAGNCFPDPVLGERPAHATAARCSRTTRCAMWTSR